MAQTEINRGLVNVTASKTIGKDDYGTIQVVTGTGAVTITLNQPDDDVALQILNGADQNLIIAKPASPNTATMKANHLLTAATLTFSGTTADGTGREGAGVLCVYDLTNSCWIVRGLGTATGTAA